MEDGSGDDAQDTKYKNLHHGRDPVSGVKDPNWHEPNPPKPQTHEEYQKAHDAHMKKQNGTDESKHYKATWDQYLTQTDFPFLS